MIRWLHISDLHLNNRNFSSGRLRDELPSFLRQEGLKCDYVFCTGDIRSANVTPNDFTDEMADYLNDICNAVDVSKDRLYIVPGNHDVDIFVGGREEAIQRLLPYGGYYKPKYGHIDTEDLASIMCGREKFVEFLSKLYSDDRLNNYTNADVPHFNIETPDFNILHVDSTLAYSKSGKATDLLVGLESLYSVIRNLNKQKPTILLTHYSITSLLQDEKKFLSDVLQKNGVRLWLAGHEHDHNLQRLKYLDSLQAGELFVENDANATILIGEYDPLTYDCCVYAYTWFPEGWAKYPIIDLDGERLDTYRFQMKPVGDGGVSRELAVARQANDRFAHRLPDNLERDLVPKIHLNCNDYTLGELLDASWNTNIPHIVLLADGGMGKTTMLLDFCKSADYPVLYVSAEQLASLGMGIVQYCARCLYEGDMALLDKCLTAKYRVPTLTIFVDGLNEVDGTLEQAFVKEIQQLSFLNGIQILISSRSDFTIRYNLPSFQKAVLCELSEKNIKGLFSDDEWRNIEQSQVLMRLLCNPMMVTIYKEICSVVNDYRNVPFLDWIFPITCEADLFHNYYVAQQALLMRREQVDGKKVLLSQVCLDEVLPNIAYAYESSFRINMEDNKFRQILKDVLTDVVIDEDKANSIREFYRDSSALTLDSFLVTDFLANEMRFLYKENGLTAFPHQMYRDYLSAKYIIRRSNNDRDILSLWNSRELPIAIMSYIRQIGGLYWRGIAQKIRHAAIGKLELKVLAQNLLDTFPSTEEDNVADYSEMDLRGVTLPNNIAMPTPVSLNDSTIDEVSLGISLGTPVCHMNLCLSLGKDYLATWADYKIYIFSLLNSSESFVFDFEKKVAKMLFLDDRLFVLSGNLSVFSYKDGWHYSGAIGKDGGICSKLKLIIVAEGRLHLYYPNREVVYDLVSLECIAINQGKDIYLQPVDGIDITSISRFKKNECDGSFGEIDRTGDDNLHVVSYADGRLVLEHEKSVVGILSRGKPKLMDAAISGDGSRAVTMSYEAFDGRRRVQLWNLDEGVKVAELSCPSSVESIHLSERGDWMLGRQLHSTWVYDVKSYTERIFNEHFLQSHRGKILCKEDCVIRKKESGRVCLYNLRTGKESNLDSPIPNPSLICFLRDGSVAAVNGSGRTAKLRSFRDGSILMFNGDGASINSISSFKEQPFIAVALEDGRLDIYHTGNGAVLRHLDLPASNSMMVVHPQKTIIAESDGRRVLRTHYFFEIEQNGQKRGWWKKHPYNGSHRVIDGDILDIGFNIQNDQLVAVLSNGRLLFCSDDWTDFRYSFNIITAFDVSAYNFSYVKCSEELKDTLRRNGAFVSH